MTFILLLHGITISPFKPSTSTLPSTTKITGAQTKYLPVTTWLQDVPVGTAPLFQPSDFDGIGRGPRPSGAPRIPARAPRATMAHMWRAFPPETSSPATRPRRGLAPRRKGDWDLCSLIARHTVAPSNRPGLLAWPMRIKKYLGAFASSAVRERQVARRVSRRRATRPTGPPIARNYGSQRHLHPCVSAH